MPRKVVLTPEQIRFIHHEVCSIGGHHTFVHCFDWHCCCAREFGVSLTQFVSQFWWCCTVSIAFRKLPVALCFARAVFVFPSFVSLMFLAPERAWLLRVLTHSFLEAEICHTGWVKIKLFSLQHNFVSWSAPKWESSKIAPNIGEISPALLLTQTAHHSTPINRRRQSRDRSITRWSAIQISSGRIQCSLRFGTKWQEDWNSIFLRLAIAQAS